MYLESNLSESKKEKNILEELNKSLDLLKNIQDNAAHALISGDVSGVITSFNRKAEEMLGYHAKDIVGKETPAIFHDLDEVVERAKEFSEKLGENIEPGYDTFICHSRFNQKNEFEWTYIHKDGKRFPVLLSITALKDGADRIIGYLGIAQDLSERKSLEKELLKKNQELELAQSIARIGSWIFDLDSGKISWSKGMYKIFPEDPDRGEPDYEKHKSTIHPEDVEHWSLTVAKSIKDGMPYLMRFRTHKLIDRNQVVWVEARGQGVIQEGKIVSLSGTCQDITDLVLREEELERKAEALKKAEKAKTEFLANMSHEIRTPMNGIFGMLDILRDTELSIEQKDMLDTISVSSEGLLNLLSDILDLSKIEAEKLELEISPFNANELINDICNLINSKAQINGSHIIPKINDLTEVWYLGDKSRIRQILLNFLSNSVKFTSNGKIEIGFKVLESNTENIKIRFHVIDNGIGISKENKQKLFNAFEQADTSITRKFGGTGLGLSISSKLAELMGGSVYFESKIEEGAKFYFEVTLKKAIAPSSSTKIDSKKVKLSQSYPHRILIAEDNPINQKVARLFLERLGYNCDIAENGAKAIELLDTKPVGFYTIILMDIQMPELDGISATKEIIKRWGDKAPNIVALTANAFTTDKENCLKAGMIDYLSKPLKKDALSEILIKYSLS